MLVKGATGLCYVAAGCQLVYQLLLVALQLIHVAEPGAINADLSEDS